MSVRAIKKKELNQQIQQKPYNKKFKERYNYTYNSNTNPQEQQQQRQQQKHLIDGGRNCSKGLVTVDDTNFKNKRSKSYPNLLTKHEQCLINGSVNTDYRNLHINQSNYTNSYRSEPDITRMQEQISSNKLAINSKSEICLKTISVHNTVPTNALNSNTYRNTISDKIVSNCQNQNNMCIGYTNETQSIQNLYNDRDTFSRINSSSTIPSSLSINDVNNVTTSGGFADTSNIRIPIIGYEVMEERARFTVYKLRIENPFTNNCWLVLRRYTDFVRLNNKLRTTFPNNVQLQLPRKKLFGDNFSSVFLTNRVQGLQIYINTIMANPIIKNSKIVRDFFCLDEPPSYSESMEECRAIFEAQEETITHLKIQLNAKDDLIEQLKHKLELEEKEKDILKNTLKQSCNNCGKCSKDIENYLKNTVNLQEPTNHKIN